jgi:hypothetical protein
MDRRELVDDHNRSLRDVNLSLKNVKPTNTREYTQQQMPSSPMFFSDKGPSKTMIRAEFFLINRNAEPSYLFSALLHEMPSINCIFTIEEHAYQVKDYTRTLIPGKDSKKVREGDVKVLVMYRYPRKE